MQQLVGLWDSPFVRRAVITMRLYGMDFEPVKISVYRHADQLHAINPQLTVPALVLDSGDVLIDSDSIIDHLDEVYGRERALTPAFGAERRAVLNVIAQASVACDKVGQLYRELEWRPEAVRYAPAIDRFRNQIADTYALLEDRLQGDWYVGKRMTQADVAVAVMVRFVAYYGDKLACLPAGSYPRLQALSQRCEAMPAFIATPLD
ncbi:MAG TPA: glutathione S-transferase family protein [Burkholderiaceae bacterium]